MLKTQELIEELMKNKKIRFVCINGNKRLAFNGFFKRDENYVIEFTEIKEEKPYCLYFIYNDFTEQEYNKEVKELRKLLQCYKVTSFDKVGREKDENNKYAYYVDVRLLIKPKDVKKVEEYANNNKNITYFSKFAELED